MKSTASKFGTALWIVISGALLLACGSGTESIGSSPEVPATVDEPRASLGEDDPAMVDLAMQTPDRYESRLCEEEGFAAVEAGTGSRVLVSGEVEYPNASSLASSGLVVAVATVKEAGRGVEFTPLLDDETLAYLGGKRESYAISFTPIVLAVAEELVGSAGTPVVTASELGCIPPNAVASTTAGIELVVVLEALPDDLGPDRAFGSTHRVIDWFAIEEGGRLSPRLGVLGAPSSAPFMIGMTVDQLRAELVR